MEKKIKVLHVIGHLGKGGDSTAVFNVMNYIEENKKNLELDFLTHNGYDEKVYKEIKKNHKIYVISNDARKMNLIKYYKEICKILKNNNYDAIHFHTSFQSCIGLLAAKRCKVKKRICHSHTSSVQRKGNKVIELIALPICRVLIELLSTEKVACSKEASKNLFINQKNVKIIYNGLHIDNICNINTQEVVSIKKTIDYKKNDVIVGQVGRFSEMKNQLFTIKLAEQNKNIKFVLLGNGEKFEEIKDYVESKKISNVYLVGKVSNVQDYMSIFNFLLLPSKYGEGLPVVLIEQQIVNHNCVCIANSNISKESNLGNVEFVDINEIKGWIEIINKREIDKPKKIDFSQFDINVSAEKWISIYK